MDYSQFEQDYPHRAFKDRRKKKCSGVKGKTHKWVHTAGNDCRWYDYYYSWMTKSLWNYRCGCTAECADCGKVQHNYDGRLCMHKDWKAFTKPKDE